MGEAYILRRGSGGIPGNWAVIVARVPSGSTVTATKGSITLTPKMWVTEADPAQDIALFALTPAQFDSENPWTITATDGANTVSKTVLITTNKEYEVTIEFTHWLYHAGNQCTDLTGGWEATANAERITFGPKSIDFAYYSGVSSVSTKQAVSTSGYTTLYARINATSGIGNIRFGIRSGGEIVGENHTAYTRVDRASGETTIAFSLATYQGDYFVGFSSYEMGFSILDVWAER